MTPVMRRFVVSVGLAALVLAGAACGDDGGGGSATATTAGAGGRTTTTAGEATTTTASTAPVTPEEEARRAAVNLLEVRNQVFQAPDLARVTDYATDTSNLAENDRSQLQMAIDQGAYWSGPPLTLLGARVTDFSVPDSPVLVLAVAATDVPIVDATGAAVASNGDGSRFAFSVTLVRDGDTWRVSNAAKLNQFDEDLLAAIVTEGLP
jgi:hypothetical protein